jgi:hypothetical protein
MVLITTSVGTTDLLAGADDDGNITTPASR